MELLTIELNKLFERSRFVYSVFSIVKFWLRKIKITKDAGIRSTFFSV